jgi:hypothetical protein
VKVSVAMYQGCMSHMSVEEWKVRRLRSRRPTARAQSLDHPPPYGAIRFASLGGFFLDSSVPVVVT